MKWDRIRFHANPEDYRPVTWPPAGPYWCSGEGDGYSVVVAYMPHGTTDEQLREFWPEASNIDRMQENVDITYSSRFAKPTWWKE